LLPKPRLFLLDVYYLTSSSMEGAFLEFGILFDFTRENDGATLELDLFSY